MDDVRSNKIARHLKDKMVEMPRGTLMIGRLGRHGVGYVTCIDTGGNSTLVSLRGPNCLSPSAFVAALAASGRTAHVKRAS